ncbi:MAG: porin [Pseudomonadota bacterium]
MHYRKSLFATLLVGSGIIAGPITARADDSGQLQQLRTQVQDLDQKIRLIEQNKGAASPPPADVQKQNPSVISNSPGYGVISSDGTSELKLHGLIQADGRFYGGSGIASGNSSANAVPASDTMLLREFRPILQGTVWSKYDFLFTPDFGNGKVIVVDAFLNARFTPAVQVEIGKQKTPFGLERLQGEADRKFLEVALTNNLVPNRDIGVQLHGLVANGTVDYALGHFNGVVDSNSTDAYTAPDTNINNNKDFAARVFARPFNSAPGLWQGLGVGLAATYGTQHGTGGVASAATLTQSDLPGFKTALGQQTFFAYRNGSGGAPAAGNTYANGQRSRLSPQFYYYVGPFGVLGEYIRTTQDVARTIAAGVNRQDALSNTAWQIAASWLLTGEKSGFANPVPKRVFESGPNGGWGAWELAARYSVLTVDDRAFAAYGTGTASAQQLASYADPRAAARRASAWAAGVNWYLNTNVKLLFDYEQTRFNGGWTDPGATAILDRPTEHVISARMQVAF